MIFITGVGRSGTSTVARVIHQSGIACMGHEFNKPNINNPKGFWEDLHIRERVLPILMAGSWRLFLAEVEEYHRSRGCKATTLGFKHPMLCDVLRETWLDFKPTLFWAYRREDLILASMLKRSIQKSWVKSKKALGDMFEYRMFCLESNIIGLPFVHKLDFSEFRTDEWVLQQILMHL